MCILGLFGCQTRSEVSSVVRVEAGGFAGSGVIIEVDGNKAVVVTAAHVLAKLIDRVENIEGFASFRMIDADVHAAA
jgi:S1-C subfamily serine protease